VRWRVRGLGDRHEFEHFVERHAEDSNDLLFVGKAAPPMHRDARLYAAQLLSALSFKWRDCHGPGMWRPSDATASAPARVRVVAFATLMKFGPRPRAPAFPVQGPPQIQRAIGAAA